MADFYDDTGLTTADREPAPAQSDATAPDDDGPAPPFGEAPVSPEQTHQDPPSDDPAVARFKSCRWHETQDGDLPDYCSNRDVMPFAGKNGFSPEAWCPECELYKLKRTVKKRRDDDWDDY